MNDENQITYKSAGVDQKKKDAVIDKFIGAMRKTYTPNVIENPWGFASFYSLTPTQTLFDKKFKAPVLVSCSDGVGTKLKIAFMMNKHNTIGIDLVAMNVNDLIAHGAEPLFFLDYISTSKVNPKILGEVFEGIVKGCQIAGCSLIGGETAEMPGFYKEDEYDVAGFIVGIVEKKKLLPSKNIKPGDLIIGIQSNGLHSNGYSLVRKVLFENKKYKCSDHISEFGQTLGEELLRPTKIYSKIILSLLKNYKLKKMIKGIAHITGGGIIENLPRIIPENTDAVIITNSWFRHPIFDFIQKSGKIQESEMFNVFNMGIGMVLIVDKVSTDLTIKRLDKMKEKAYIIGEIHSQGNREVILKE